MFLQAIAQILVISLIEYLIFFAIGFISGIYIYLARFNVANRIFYFWSHLRASLLVAVILGLLSFFLSWFLLIPDAISILGFLYLILLPVLFFCLFGHVKAQHRRLSRRMVSFLFLFGNYFCMLSLLLLATFCYLSYAYIFTPFWIVVGCLFASWTAYVLNIIVVEEANYSSRIGLSIPPTIMSTSAIDYSYNFVFKSSIFPQWISLAMLLVGILIILLLIGGKE